MRYHWVRKLNERKQAVGAALSSPLPCTEPFLPYFMPHKARKLENIIYAPTLYSGGILAPNPKAGNILSLEKKKKKKEFPQRNEMHFVTINTYSSVSIHQKCKAAQ